MDPHATARDPVLTRFRAEVRALYGERLERVLLFGSRARGDHGADSDYDIAVFLHDMESLWDELGKLAPIVTDILVETDEMITALPFKAGAYRGPTPFMANIRRDGLDL